MRKNVRIAFPDHSGKTTQSPTTEQTLVSFNQPPPQYLSTGQVFLDLFQPNPTQCLDAGGYVPVSFNSPPPTSIREELGTGRTGLQIDIFRSQFY